jgi:hypothetical protein
MQSSLLFEWQGAIRSFDGYAGAEAIKRVYSALVMLEKCFIPLADIGF